LKRPPRACYKSLTRRGKKGDPLTEWNSSFKSLEFIEAQAFRNETVRLDGKSFLDCSFVNCLLCYGGGQCEWENTRFSKCRIVLDGPANDTIQTLQGLGFVIEAPVLATDTEI